MRPLPHISPASHAELHLNHPVEVAMLDRFDIYDSSHCVITRSASRGKRRRIAAAISLGFILGAAITCAAADSLVDGFRDPPNAARPRVWWHWLNGNIAKEGITLDLEWMKRIGIGGAESFQGFLGPMGPGKVVDNQLAYMSDGWQDAMHHAAVTADRLGLELGIAASPGWSETGGPWVPAAHGMKKFVWSETYVDGGQPFHAGTLPRPPDVTGPYQGSDAWGLPVGDRWIRHPEREILCR